MMFRLPSPGVLSLIVLLLACGAGAAEPGDAERQAELDRRCEAARAVKLAPIREDVYRECLEKKQGDVAYCRRFGDAYNGNRSQGGPRFYELPACQAAFEFRNRARD